MECWDNIFAPKLIQNDYYNESDADAYEFIHIQDIIASN